MFDRGDKNLRDKKFFLFDGNNWKLSFRAHWDESSSFVFTYSAVAKRG